MKRPSSKIREEISRLQEQLKQAETREAERIGRIALKAGLGEIDIDEAELQTALEELARRFRNGKPVSTGRKREPGESANSNPPAAIPSGDAAGGDSEA